MITKTVVLACLPARAFALFTERASEWWPETLRHTADPASEIRMLASGRFWERAADGTEVELGRVREWQPPRRVVIDFYPGTDPGHPTEVVIRFSDDGGGTRVDVQHGPTPQSLDLWEQAAPRYDRAWDLVLRALSRAVDEGNTNVTIPFTMQRRHR